MNANNFNLIAPFYDQIAKLIFGDHLIKSQRRWIDEIEENSSVLILGGGTGQLLNYLPKCDKITYLEKAEKMLKIAKKRSSDSCVEYITEDFFTWQNNQTYDVIICPFFLDCFNHLNLEEAIVKCGKLLKPSGRLLVTDFDKDNMHQLLSIAMHAFFKVFSKLESNKLLDIHAEAIRNGFFMVKEDFFYQRMIFSRVYRNL